MSDDMQDKSEEPTDKKLEDAKKKGQVAKSADLVTAGVVLGALILLAIFSVYLLSSLATITTGVFNNLNEPIGEPALVIQLFNSGLVVIIEMLGPYFFLLCCIALLVNVGQFGFILSGEPIKPKWNKANPFNPSNYKKFFNSQALVKLIMGLSKLAVVGFSTYLVLDWQMAKTSQYIEESAGSILYFIFLNAFIIGIITGIILLILGVIDFIYQTWKFKQDQKMSKQDIKEERKQMEGDAQMKGRMRSMMQAFSQSRVKSSVPQSDVVIANPIHFAIAVKYDAEEMAAPVCMAKGARRMALYIKELAKENSVVVVENPPLARMLYRAVEVGELIPPQFYHTVAEVLAYVYRLNEKLGKERGFVPAAAEESSPATRGAS